MANINWQNLPSETTPINSTNLNVMSAGLVNVSTEVDDTYRVNLLHSKNVLNYSGENEYSVKVLSPDITTTYDTSNNKVIYTVNSLPQASSQAGYYYEFNTEIGKTYKVKSKWLNTSGDTISNVRICSDTSGTTIINNMTSDTEYSFTATKETYYFRVWITYSIGSGYVQNAIVSSGNTTTYEPYIPNQIVVDNEKYSDTLNVGSLVDNKNRVNLLKTKNLFDGVNQSVFLTSAVNQGQILSGNTGLYIKVKGGNYTISTTASQTRYRVACMSSEPSDTFQTAYNGVNKDGTSDTITIDTTGYNYLIVNATDLSKIYIAKGNTPTTEPFIQNQIVVDNEKYSDTLNVGTSVDNRNRVNVLHSKNLTDGIWENGGWSNTGEKVDSPSFMRTANPIYVKPNTTYTLKISESNNQIVVYYYSSSAYINLAFVQHTDTYTFTTPANCVKINFRLSGQSLSLTNTMLNEGNTLLPYEPYITPSIYVDNEMLVSKNIYSSSEVVIGEWLGKPLYRKVVEITNPTLDAWTNVNHNISNMDFGRIVDATLTRTIYGTTSYIPIGVSNISAGTLFTCDLQKPIIEYKIAGYTNITKLIAVLEYTKTTD